MIINRKVVIIHNIIAPYKVALFNELNKLISNLEVIFIAEKEKRRDWNIDYAKIKFPFTVLFKGSIDSINSFTIAKETWRILEKIRPETSIICDYSNIFGWSALFWAKKNKNNLIFWLSSTFEDRKHTYIKNRLKQYFLKHFDAGLAPGSRTKQYFEILGMDTSKIIKTGYGVDNNYFINRYNKYYDKKDLLIKQLRIIRNHNFIYIGRFANEKNIFTLLKSFSNLKNNKWGLLLLGDGPLKEEINSYIVDNKLEDKIQLVGFIQQDEIVKYLIVSNVFILPSLSEPWGLVVNEAMLCRLPVIVSTKCGSQPELVKEGINGYSFDPNNELKLKNLMQGFVNGSYNSKSMGEASLIVVKKHSPSIIAQNIVVGIKAFI